MEEKMEVEIITELDVVEKNEAANTELMKIEDLKIESKITPAVYDFNFQELETALEKMLKDYTSLVVTEETLKGAKNAKSELASLRIRLEEFRKETKKKGEAATKEFEKNCNKLTDLVKKAEAPLFESIDVFDEKEREKKRALALASIEENIKTYNLREKFAKQMVVKPEYSNVNASKKGNKEDIKKQAEVLSLRQEAEDRDIQAVTSFIESENERINIKIKPESYIAMVENGSKLDDILKLIADQAADIYEQENKVVEPVAVEPVIEEPIVEETVISEPVEEETVVISQGVVFNPDDLFPEEDDYMAEQYSETSTDVNEDSLKPAYVPSVEVALPFANPVEQTFEVTFKLTGQFSKLSEVNAYLKATGLTMEVISQVQI